jgi:hypothetical protein
MYTDMLDIGRLLDEVPTREYACKYCGRIRKDRTTNCLSCGGHLAELSEPFIKSPEPFSVYKYTTVFGGDGKKDYQFFHNLNTFNLHWQMNCEDDSIAIVDHSMDKVDMNSVSLHFAEPPPRLKILLFG